MSSYFRSCWLYAGICAPDILNCDLRFVDSIYDAPVPADRTGWSVYGSVYSVLLLSTLVAGVAAFFLTFFFFFRAPIFYKSCFKLVPASVLAPKCNY